MRRKGIADEISVMASDGHFCRGHGLFMPGGPATTLAPRAPGPDSGLAVSALADCGKSLLSGLLGPCL